MDFIERWFHISPDGGNGLTELAIVIAVAALIAVVFCRRQLAALAKRWASRTRKRGD